jgi:hypothetical protein
MMTPDEMRAAIEAMAREKEEQYSELRKPTSTEVPVACAICYPSAVGHCVILAWLPVLQHRV